MPAKQSLTVVLPVHNAQDTVSKKISTLLEFLPDLTRCFEILIVDDGSDDHTVEIAHELARVYPQVTVAKHTYRRGRNGIVETALASTAGDILFIQDENAPIDSSKFHRLWTLRDNEQPRIPLAKLRTRPSLFKRLAAWGIQFDEATRNRQIGGLQMINRLNQSLFRSQTTQSATFSSSNPSSSVRTRVDGRDAIYERRTNELANWENVVAESDS